MKKSADAKLEELETQLLLEALLRRYGYDFRNYEQTAVRRRIREAMLVGRVATISRFQEKVLHEPAFLGRFLQTFSATPVAMFSDPGFYRIFRTRVVPLLKTYPFVRIWQAGCSTGEEVYSMAILLTEEGIYPRCRIYATDLSEEAVKQARKASYSLSAIDEYSNNYIEAGGKRSFSDFYQKRGNRLILDAALKKNIVFSEHNLATDGSFNEFQVIACRNVLASFNRTLRQRVDSLIYDSLSRFGVLALGAGESLKSMQHEASYSVLDEASGLYQKLAAGTVTRAG